MAPKFVPAETIRKLRDQRFSYDAGIDYARSLNPIDRTRVDIPHVMMATNDMPPDDYHYLVSRDIEPDARRFWEGFNSQCEWGFKS